MQLCPHRGIADACSSYVAPAAGNKNDSKRLNSCAFENKQMRTYVCTSAAGWKTIPRFLFVISFPQKKKFHPEMHLSRNERKNKRTTTPSEPRVYITQCQFSCSHHERTQSIMQEQTIPQQCTPLLRQRQTPPYSRDTEGNRTITIATKIGMGLLDTHDTKTCR